MKPYITITFPCGQIYQVPTEFLAEKYADRTRKNMPLGTESEVSEYVASRMQDEAVVTAFARTLTWDEIKDGARMVGVAVSLDAEWDSATICAGDRIAPPALTAEGMLQLPVVVSLAATPSSGATA